MLGLFGLFAFIIFIVYAIFVILKGVAHGVAYIAKPVLEQCEEYTTVNTQITEVTDKEEPTIPTIPDTGEPIKVEIKDSKFNSSKIVAYTGEEIKQFEFRPQTWQQFIAQNFAKEQAKTIMKKAKRNIRSHFILSAIKGHGKTTFVELFAQNIGAKLIQRIGKQIDEDELLNIINEINSSKSEYVVLFIDEIDSMDWKVIKILNPIIEQFKINEVKIKPFIFACATINKHILIKNNPDTLDRIPHHIQFTRYTPQDIATIIKQYKQQLYAEETVSEETIRTISENCKSNPRTSISLLEDFIVLQDMTKVLSNRHIIKNGLTKLDIRILEILSKATRAMGSNALAMRVGIGEQQYLREYEPYLIEFDYIARIPSRIITEKGKQMVKEANVCEKQTIA